MYHRSEPRFLYRSVCMYVTVKTCNEFKVARQNSTFQRKYHKGICPLISRDRDTILPPWTSANNTLRSIVLIHENGQTNGQTDGHTHTHKVACHMIKTGNSSHMFIFIEVHAPHNDKYCCDHNEFWMNLHVWNRMATKYYVITDILQGHTSQHWIRRTRADRML